MFLAVSSVSIWKEENMYKFKVSSISDNLIQKLFQMYISAAWYTFPLFFSHLPFSYKMVTIISYSLYTSFFKNYFLSLKTQFSLTLFKNVFLTLSVFPDGRTPTVRGIGGSPSFCWRLSATTRNARRPIDMRSGVMMILIWRPTESRSKTISRIAKSSLSWIV